MSKSSKVYSVRLAQADIDAGYLVYRKHFSRSIPARSELIRSLYRQGLISLQSSSDLSINNNELSPNEELLLQMRILKPIIDGHLSWSDQLSSSNQTIRTVAHELYDLVLRTSELVPTSASHQQVSP